MKICVYGAASSEIDKCFVEAGEELGRKMADRNIGLVFGGGRNGMMGAVARGVAQNGGNILGISPKFFEENNAEISFPECSEFIHKFVKIGDFLYIGPPPVFWGVCLSSDWHCGR